ncbi:MAG: ferrous iron transport protein B [Oligoflexales bacterium]|nr:ferrous iron transport protein B [Oligoflexales bacterium]
MSVIALVGAPNTGKSSLFSALTGTRQKIGNYPGVTVEKKHGFLTTPSGRKVDLIDLPGTYSLAPQSPDEKIVEDFLKGKTGNIEKPDLVLVVIDATNLSRTMSIALSLKEQGFPFMVALNMYDLAKSKGLKLDLIALEKELGAPVVPTIAVKRDGLRGLLNKLDRTLDHGQGNAQEFPSHDWKLSVTDLIDTQQRVDEILKRVVRAPTQADKVTQAIDRVLLHPFFGGLILMGILFTMFQAVFSWAEKPMELVEQGITGISSYAGSLFGPGLLQSFVCDGLIAGVGSVLVFLPQILILFFFILLLESSGYMPRAAFIMDRVMGMLGLEGRSFVPLLSSFACAIPGIMATRTIGNPRDRLLTIMVAPLMTCSARLPVYTLLIGAFIPDSTVWGIFNLQGVVMFSLFIFAVISAMLVAFVIKTFALPGPKATFLMDLPTYKLPHFKYIFMSLFQRTKAFLKKAGTLILMISVVLWALSTFPRPPENADQAPINYSVAGRVGQAIEPLVKPIGFDWRIATGLIPGFAAREVMVGALGTVFAVEDAEDSGQALLQNRIKNVWPVSTGLALLVWYIFAPQCLATFAVARRETNSSKWPMIMFGYMLALAYLGAFVTFHLSSWLLAG